MLLLSITIVITGCSLRHKDAEQHAAFRDFNTTGSGLRYKILKPGIGPETKIGDEVAIRETTSSLNGTVLYSNENGSRTIKVKIGAGQATLAVDEGLRGMKEGEVRQLIAPPSFGTEEILSFKCIPGFIP